MTRYYPCCLYACCGKTAAYLEIELLRASKRQQDVGQDVDARRCYRRRGHRRLLLLGYQECAMRRRVEGAISVTVSVSICTERLWSSILDD